MRVGTSCQSTSEPLGPEARSSCPRGAKCSSKRVAFGKAHRVSAEAGDFLMRRAVSAAANLWAACSAAFLASRADLPKSIQPAQMPQPRRSGVSITVPSQPPPTQAEAGLVGG
jgi:hypothetical protein